MKSTTTKVMDSAKRVGMTNAEISVLCGVHVKTVSKWRAGRPPSLDTIAPLLRALDLLDGLD